jgi:hypothetical protein
MGPSFQPTHDMWPSNDGCAERLRSFSFCPGSRYHDLHGKTTTVPRISPRSNLAWAVATSSKLTRLATLGLSLFHFSSWNNDLRFFYTLTKLKVGQVSY